MKMTFFKKAFIISLFILLFSLKALFPQSPERFFDGAEPTSKEVRLAILYPSLGSIKSILELRNQGLLPQEELIVIGIYHEKEVTDYQKSKDFVEAKGLEWFKFHKVSGELNKDTLFEKNPCSADFEMIFKKSDGIIFFGGADIPPAVYKDKANLLTVIQTPSRSFLEISFIFHLLGGLQDKNFKALLDSSPQFPVLGICLGAQSLNVGAGGTLIQDIWSEKYGKKYLEDVLKLGKENWHTNPLARLFPEEKLFPYSMHPIRLREKSIFCTVLGFKKKDTPWILSAHHQMVDKLGKGIKVSATSLDGKVVEAIEHERYPHLLGVQFHPEFPVLWDSSQKIRFTAQDEEETNLPLFLEKKPPSLDFHKKIWTWFSEKLKEYHQAFSCLKPEKNAPHAQSPAKRKNADNHAFLD